MREALAGQIGHHASEAPAAMRQLALPFAHRPRFARADFVAAASNAEALAWLDRGRDARWPDHRLALWGEAGCGKTHLLQLWARDHDEHETRGCDQRRQRVQGHPEATGKLAFASMFWQKHRDAL